MSKHYPKRSLSGASNRFTVRLDRRELATILAALRMHQDENLQSSGQIPDAVVNDIATDGGKITALSCDETEQLQHRLAAIAAFSDWRSCRHKWRQVSRPGSGCGIEFWFECQLCLTGKYRHIEQDGAENVFPPEDDPPLKKVLPTAKGLQIAWPQPQSCDQPLFTVVYVIDVNAENAKEAAELAYQIMIHPESMPPVLYVLDHHGSVQRINLASR